ncbi:hypothetical protein BJX64DRAFT_287748 [Aspergillus heterothallicus]
MYKPRLLALALLCFIGSTIAADTVTDTTPPGTSSSYDTESYCHPTGSSSIIPPDLSEPTDGHTHTTPPYTTTIEEPEFTGAARVLDVPVYATFGVFARGFIV